MEKIEFHLRGDENPKELCDLIQGVAKRCGERSLRVQQIMVIQAYTENQRMADLLRQLANGAAEVKPSPPPVVHSSKATLQVGICQDCGEEAGLYKNRHLRQLPGQENPCQPQNKFIKKKVKVMPILPDLLILALAFAVGVLAGGLAFQLRSRILELERKLGETRRAHLK